MTRHFTLLLLIICPLKIKGNDIVQEYLRDEGETDLVNIFMPTVQ